MAFLGPDEFLVLEKNTGKVQHVMGGEVQNTALDLAVNNSSERGLLGIALDPDFEANNYVYLYWTCRAPAPKDPFTPSRERCPDTPRMGDDTDNILAVPLLGNRVDRFVWDSENLTFDLNLITLRSFQNDAAPEPPNQGDEDQPPAGNHNGGVLRIGADGKLYVMVGDLGRRGQLQNLPSGPTKTGLGPTVPDDQFGGPEPDDAHFTGVILRLNTDGSAPEDNPFFDVGAEMGDEVGSNIQKIFAYGIRNSFGMDVDPLTGNLWANENGEDAFDEINLVESGMNSGWIQIMGPADRVPAYRRIESTEAHDEDFPNLQQFRWGPERIARTTKEAFSRLFVLPGSHFSDPELSWKYVVPPAGLGFMSSTGLGNRFCGDMFTGTAEDEEEFVGGLLLHFNLSRKRTEFTGKRVIDNKTFDDLTGTQPYIIGEGFGILTDIHTGPNGNLYAVSLTHGAVYEVFRQESSSSSAEAQEAVKCVEPGEDD
jgi:glucose/arabinose dehydrogenase